MSPGAESEQTQPGNPECQGHRETPALGQPQAGRGLGPGEAVLESSPWLDINNFAAMSLSVLRRDWVQEGERKTTGGVGEDQRDREKEMLRWKCLCVCVRVFECECE